MLQRHFTDFIVKFHRKIRNNDNFTSVAFSTTTNGIALGYHMNTDFYRTQDGGQTWTKVSNIAFLYSVAFSSATNGVAVGRSIYRTTNGGQTWTQVLNINNGYFGSVAFAPSN